MDVALLGTGVMGGGLDAPYLHLKGGAMLAGEFAPSFSMDGAAKETPLIVDAATDAGPSLAVAQAVADQFAAGVAAGNGGLDMAAAYLNHTKA